MNKDEEIKLKVQMFCAAIRESDKNKLFWMRRTAEDVNGVFEVLKHPDDES